MKVKELIVELQKLDPETLVLVDGYEGGYTNPYTADQIEVCGPFDRAWYYGEYEDCKDKNSVKIKAYLIRR
jgi:hypothetical protein